MKEERTVLSSAVIELNLHLCFATIATLFRSRVHIDLTSFHSFFRYEALCKRHFLRFLCVAWNKCGTEEFSTDYLPWQLSRLPDSNKRYFDNLLPRNLSVLIRPKPSTFVFPFLGYSLVKSENCRGRRRRSDDDRGKENCERSNGNALAFTFSKIGVPFEARRLERGR